MDNEKDIPPVETEEVEKILEVIRDDIEKIASNLDKVAHNNVGNILRGQRLALAQQKAMFKMHMVLDKVYDAMEGVKTMAAFAPKAVQLKDMKHTMDEVHVELKKAEEEYLAPVE